MRFATAATSTPGNATSAHSSKPTGRPLERRPGATEGPGLGVVVDESRLNLIAEFTEPRPAGLYQGESLYRPDGSYLYLPTTPCNSAPKDLRRSSPNRACPQ